MLCDEDVNGYHLVAYAHLRLLMSCEEIDEYCINLDSLVFSIYGTLNVGKRIRENIYNAMNWLINSEFLSGYKANRTC